MPRRAEGYKNPRFRNAILQTLAKTARGHSYEVLFDKSKEIEPMSRDSFNRALSELRTSGEVEVEKGSITSSKIYRLSKFGKRIREFWSQVYAGIDVDIATLSDAWTSNGSTAEKLPALLQVGLRLIDLYIGNIKEHVDSQEPVLYLQRRELLYAVIDIYDEMLRRYLRELYQQDPDGLRREILSIKGHLPLDTTKATTRANPPDYSSLLKMTPEEIVTYFMRRLDRVGARDQEDARVCAA